MECAVLAIFDTEGQDYIALLPLNENGENDEGQVYLYRFFQGISGEPELENIEDDTEFELASEAFDEWMDTQEYAAMDLDPLE